MQTVRRLYLYVMSGISLGVLLVGLIILLSTVFHAAGLGPDIASGSEPNREALSLAAALIVVGLLVWGVHWYLVERSLRPDNPRHDEERGAAERALYLTLVLALLLVFGVLAGIELLVRATTNLFGLRAQTEFGFDSDSGASSATVIVTGSAWLYHVVIRQRDLRAGPLAGAGAWMPRVYLYGATLVGLILTSYNIGTLLGTGVAATTGRVVDDDFGLSPERQAAIAVAGIVGWGVVWLGHWWYATAITRGTGWRAESERAARLRVAFFVAAIGSMALATAIFAFMALNGALSLALGADAVDGAPTAIDTIARPLVSLIPWAAAWLLHRTWLFAEAGGANDPARMATADRLDASIVALVGLAALAGGLTGLLHLLFNAVLGVDAFGANGNGEPALSLAAAAIGAVLWLWNWSRLQARRARAPLDEASSTVRRAYLLIVVGVSVILGLGSLAFVLYRLFAAVLDVGFFENPLSETSGALALLLVAVVAAAYHGLVLRDDQALKGEAAGEDAAEATVKAAAPASRVLVLTGPTNADLDATVAAMRAALPPELSLETHPPDG
jgi:uncharacterized protein DUF5671